MNTFVNTLNTVEENKTVTTNGMPTFRTSENSLLDLFYQIGSARKKDISLLFKNALDEDKHLALKILLWARDVREGAGERQTFRNLFNYYVQNYNSDEDFKIQLKIVRKISELGRWDDLLYIPSGMVRSYAIGMYCSAIDKGNALAAKWAPRKGPIAVELTQAWGMTPKQYRKTIVNLTKVVETQMCAKNWSEINYSHVPSVASSRYMTAFYKNDAERFTAWREGLKSGRDKDGNAVKINASVVYPYDVIRALQTSHDTVTADAQWAALPDYMNSKNVLSLVDVSGSMSVSVSGSVRAVDVAVSLGLYISEKSKGAFKDVFVTFSEKPKILKLSGSLSDRFNQMIRSDWGYNTNFVAAMHQILQHAIKYSVPQEDMPETLIILSDMQFDHAMKDHNLTVHQKIRVDYANAGYNMPNIVFWNLNSPLGQSPVKHNAAGVALVSGFSPTILKMVLGNNMNPMKILLDTVDKPRYSLEG